MEWKILLSYTRAAKTTSECTCTVVGLLILFFDSNRVQYNNMHAEIDAKSRQNLQRRIIIGNNNDIDVCHFNIYIIIIR